MKILQGNTNCAHSSSTNISTIYGNGDLKTCEPDLSRQVINDHVADILVAVFQVAVTGIFAAGGLVTNTINIVVFFKMGLNDAVNISLFCLAVGDFCALVCSVWESFCFNPLVEEIGAPVVFSEIEYITGCWPHVCFVRVTSYITAFVSFERCLCITLPLKVKTIITTARTKAVMVAIFLVVAATSAPEYYVTQLTWKFYPELNRTMLGIFFIEDRERFESVTLVLNNIVLQIVTFVSVFVCTIILAVELSRKAKWRQQIAKGERGNSEKDKRVIKMITLISLIFIVCELPSVVNVLAMAFTPEIHPSGVYYNTFYVIWSMVYVTESINSAVNIFVYFNMSSKYKAVFKKTFLRHEVSAPNSQLPTSKRGATQHSETSTTTAA